MAAEIERDLLRERTTAALQARKANGLPIGRQTGATGKRNKLSGKESEIDHLIAAKISGAAIARLMGCSRQTLSTFQKMREGMPCIEGQHLLTTSGEKTL
jgi:DNA invertase Pin-like site-specific DNA recombinase